jgi:hypothetical protein
LNKENTKLSFLENISIYDFLEDNISIQHSVFSFSFHSHWLDYEETISVPMSYNEMISKNSNLDKYNGFRNNLIKLFNYLYKNFSLYSIIITEDEEELYSFESFNEVKNKLDSLLEEKEQVNIIISELSLVILSNYDLTFPVYVLNKDSDRIKKIFQDFKINILD